MRLLVTLAHIRCFFFLREKLNNDKRCCTFGVSIHNLLNTISLASLLSRNCFSNMNCGMFLNLMRHRFLSALFVGNICFLFPLSPPHPSSPAGQQIEKLIEEFWAKQKKVAKKAKPNLNKHVGLAAQVREAVELSTVHLEKRCPLTHVPERERAREGEGGRCRCWNFLYPRNTCRLGKGCPQTYPECGSRLCSTLVTFSSIFSRIL